MSPGLQSRLVAAGLASALLLCTPVPAAAQGVDEPPLRLEESEDPFPQPETPPVAAEDSNKTAPTAAPDVTVTTTDAPPPPKPPPEPVFADPTETTDVPAPVVTTPPEPPPVPEIAAPEEKPPEIKKKETVKKTLPPVAPPVEKKKVKKKEKRNADPKPPAETRVARLLSEGRAFLKAKKLTTPKGASAADRFRSVLALEPGNRAARDGLNEIAATYSGWGEWALNSNPKKALRYLQSALALAPDNAASYRLKGQAHQNLGQWRQALAAHRKAQSIRPDPRADEFAIGHALAAGLKRYREALPHLEKAKGYLPNSAVLYNDLADSYHNLGMQPKAVAAVKIRNRLERQAPKKKSTRKKKASRGGNGGRDTTLAQAHAALARGDYDAAQRGYFAATAKGNREASYRLGRMYHQGLGFRRDLSKAMIHYKHAAIGGHPGGKVGLGYMYYRGLGGLRRNYREAFKNFLAAAKAGISGAQYRVGHMYEKGQGVARNSRNASYWYITAARKGNRAARKRLIELKMKPSGPTFAAPAEINTGPGELPELSAPTTGLTVERVPARKPPPPKPRKRCGGMIGGLGGC